MHLDVPGHPLHTRALAVTLDHADDRTCDVHATILDLRKRGFVPVGGDLQTPGVIHHMRLDGAIDVPSGSLRALRAGQPSVAFEPSALTAGESCRDPIARVEALAGVRLDEAFARAAGAAVGGPRGCSHVLTLAHLLGSTAPWALARDRARHATPPARRPGERLFRRDVVIDGHEVARGRVVLGAQLTDLEFAPAPALARPMDRFAAVHEVRLRADVDLARFALVRVTGAERSRGRDDLATAPWRSRDDVLEPLADLGLGPGVTAALLARFAAEPLRDALLMLAPTLVQCMAALSETWPMAALGSESRVGIGGLPDSCYMWRRGGALLRARDDEGAPPLRA